MRRDNWMGKMALAAIAVCGAALTACSPQEVAVSDVLKMETVGQNETGTQTAEVQTAGAESEPRSVTVTASGTVKAAPDMARIVYEIVTEDADAVRCQQKNAETLDAVIAYLKEQGMADSSIRTSDFSLEPRYDWSGNRQRLIGYTMTTQLEAADIPMEQVGTLLSGAVGAGANRIRSVSYYSSRYDEAYEEALALAMDMAKAKAEALAHAGGCQVTEILRVEEHMDSQEGRYVDAGLAMSTMEEYSAASDTAAMAVMAGEMEVEADITVEYLLLEQ